jgi:proteic killer suppression protein|tara:strand:- start:201 stop:479 length:279 start_codon:yes stop_codon:yes gene_type:complete
MIVSFKHRGLKRLYEKGDKSRIDPNHVDKVELILADLAAAEAIDEMRVPGYRLHELHGELKDFYAVEVSGNWRIIFKFEDGQASDINLVDYH